MSDKREEPPRFRDALEEKVRSAEKPESRGGAPDRAARQAGRPPLDASILKEPIHLFGPNLAEIAAFCRQLATLLDVGIPLVRSLRILAERSQHPKLKKVAGQVATDVEEGRRLSEALARHPRIFSALLVNVTRIGEAGGILEPSLTRLAETMEQKLDIRQKIIAACMYPIAALIVAFCILLLILTQAIPIFAGVYRDTLHQDLPKITQHIISVSDFARDYYAFYIPAVILAVVLLYLFGTIPPGRRLYDWLRLHTPIVGRINTKINVARATRSLGNLLAAGIPLLEGLGIVSRTSENVLIGEALGSARDNVERGGKMDEPLRRERVFPPMVVDMMTIGDEAGALDTMLLKIADIYDSEVNSALKGLTSLIEPVLIVVLGGVVILIGLGVLLPYFRLATAPME